MKKAQWLNYLKADPLPWLLEADNPSVRYLTLVDLLKRPPRAPEVQEAKRAIPKSPVVTEILTRQHRDGYWEDQDKPQWPTKTIDALSLLMVLGVERDERIERACERILHHNQDESGGFTYTGTRSGIFICFTGNALDFLTYFGYGADPRLGQCVNFLVEKLSQKDGLRCSRNNGLPCQWAAIAALRGLSRLPRRLRDEAEREVVGTMADALLDFPFDFAGAEKRWLKFSVPPAYDLVEALSVLAQHGYAQDPRFTPLAEVLLAQQNAEGKWVKGSGGRNFPMDVAGKPSKLVTLNALKAISLMA